MLYIAGYAVGVDAEGAVRAQRNQPGEEYTACDPIMPQDKLKVGSGEVRELSSSRS